MYHNFKTRSISYTGKGLIKVSIYFLNNSYFLTCSSVLNTFGKLDTTGKLVLTSLLLQTHYVYHNALANTFSGI